jgi:hypothetical protein
MMNDPELNGKYLGTISQDFVKVADTLKEASYQLRKAGFAFPIFAIARERIPIGQLLLDQQALGLTWNYFASYSANWWEKKSRLVLKKPTKIPMSFAACLWSTAISPTSFTFPIRRINVTF